MAQSGRPGKFCIVFWEDGERNNMSDIVSTDVLPKCKGKYPQVGSSVRLHWSGIVNGKKKAGNFPARVIKYGKSSQELRKVTVNSKGEICAEGQRAFLQETQDERKSVKRSQTELASLSSKSISSIEKESVKLGSIFELQNPPKKQKKASKNSPNTFKSPENSPCKSSSDDLGSSNDSSSSNTPLVEESLKGVEESLKGVEESLKGVEESLKGNPTQASTSVEMDLEKNSDTSILSRVFSWKHVHVLREAARIIECTLSNKGNPAPDFQSESGSYFRSSDFEDETNSSTVETYSAELRLQLKKLHCPDPTKEELHKGSGIYVQSKKLVKIRMQCAAEYKSGQSRYEKGLKTAIPQPSTNSPRKTVTLKSGAVKTVRLVPPNDAKIMTRLLFELLLPGDLTFGLSAEGKKGSGSVPSDVLDAIRGFVLQNCSCPLTLTEFNTTINRKCATQRRSARKNLPCEFETSQSEENVRARGKSRSVEGDLSQLLEIKDNCGNKSAVQPTPNKGKENRVFKENEGADGVQNNISSIANTQSDGRPQMHGQGLKNDLQTAVPPAEGTTNYHHPGPFYSHNPGFYQQGYYGQPAYNYPTYEHHQSGPARPVYFQHTAQFPPHQPASKPGESNEISGRHGLTGNHFEDQQADQSLSSQILMNLS